MLDYTDLTIIKNAEGLPTALGYPINSLLLKNDKPLFVGGKGKGKGKNNDKGKNNGKNETHDTDFDNLVVPAGLVCMTETICKKPSEHGMVMGMDIDMNMDTDFDMHMPRYASDMDNSELIPEGLYDKLLSLAQETKPKKFTRRNKDKKAGDKKVGNKKGKTKKQSHK